MLDLELPSDQWKDKSVTALSCLGFMLTLLRVQSSHYLSHKRIKCWWITILLTGVLSQTCKKNNNNDTHRKLAPISVCMFKLQRMSQIDKLHYCFITEHWTCFKWNERKAFSMHIVSFFCTIVWIPSIDLSLIFTVPLSKLHNIVVPLIYSLHCFPCAIVYLIFSIALNTNIISSVCVHSLNTCPYTFDLFW